MPPIAKLRASRVRVLRQLHRGPRHTKMLFVVRVAPHVAPSRRGVVKMATAHNASASPAVSLQDSTAVSRSVVTWRRGQPEQDNQLAQDIPEAAFDSASWWLPTLLRRRGLWATETLSRDDAGAYALGLVFCAAVGFLVGAGEPSPLGVPVLPSEARQAAARASGPRLVVTDQASVRAGARTLGEQQERQRLLVTRTLTLTLTLTLEP